MNINIQPNTAKNIVQRQVLDYLNKQNLRTVDSDFSRPWGGFFVMDEKQNSHFINLYFKDLGLSEYDQGVKLSTKILIVAPGLKLSWQFHDRRSEIHKVIKGPVAYCLSKTDEQNPLKIYNNDEVIFIGNKIRHRLIGLQNWGVVAEIWQHADLKNLSDEADVHRLQDDFNRE